MQIKERAKPLVRDSIARFLSTFGVTNFSKFSKSDLVIFTFHRVLPEKLRNQHPLPGLVITPSELNWVIQKVKPYFEIRPLSNAFETLSKSGNNKPLLALTFDDGQWDNFHYGLKVLEQENLHATFYVPTNLIGSNQLLWHDVAAFHWLKLHAGDIDTVKNFSDFDFPDICKESAKTFLQYLKSLDHKTREKYIHQISHNAHPSWARLMDWNEVRQMSEKGHEIGSHSVSHQLLSRLPVEHQHTELQVSFEEIKTNIGIAPTSFCYPNGDFDERTVTLLQQSQYCNAVTTTWGLNNISSDKMKLQRFDIDPHRLCDRFGKLSLPRFQFRLSGFQTGM